MTIGEFIDTTPGLVSLVTTIAGLCYGVFRGVQWKYKALDNQEKEEIKKDTRVANAEGGTAILEILHEMELELGVFQQKIVRQGKDNAILSRLVDSYKTAVHRLTLLCDIMCPESELCKEEIKKVLVGLKLVITDAAASEKKQGENLGNNIHDGYGNDQVN